MKNVTRAVGSSGLSSPTIRWLAVLILGCGGLAEQMVFAEHEVDHRFTVEGYVCGSDSQPISGVEVMVKDTRTSNGKIGYTDSDGYYSISLHLHNDNQGDPIVVTAGDREQRLTAKFDPKDLKTERKVAVTFGSGCDQRRGPSRWVYYGVGVGLAGAAAIAGTKLIRKRRRPGKRGKGQRK
ncbi:carboxypeptidase-like regulatory domain-containing protein [Candidatus Nitrospira bockiana]